MIKNTWTLLTIWPKICLPFNTCCILSIAIGEFDVTTSLQSQIETLLWKTIRMYYLGVQRLQRCLKSNLQFTYIPVYVNTRVYVCVNRWLFIVSLKREKNSYAPHKIAATEPTENVKCQKSIPIFESKYMWKKKNSKIIMPFVPNSGRMRITGVRPVTYSGRLRVTIW